MEITYKDGSKEIIEADVSIVEDNTIHLLKRKYDDDGDYEEDDDEELAILNIAEIRCIKK